MKPSLWLTRTQPQQSNALAQGLAQFGWSVTNLPLLQIEPFAFSDAELAGIRQKIDAADWVLWTSASAVPVLPADIFARHAVPQLQAVGRRTAAQAHAHTGQNVSYPPSGHGGQAWVESMHSQWRPGQHLLVITGEGGRTDWHQGVTAAGLALESLPVYRRQPVVLELPLHPPDALVVTSGAALQALVACRPSPGVYQAPIILPSPRLNSVAREAGWSGTIANVSDLSPAAVQAALEECR